MCVAGLYITGILVTGTSNRGVNIVDLAGANNSAPVIANQVLVSERDRHVIAFGCNPEFGSDGNPTTVQDPLVIRFSSQESATDWQTRPDNTAGDLRIGTGSYIVGAVQTKQQVVVFTDIAVYTMQYIGPPYTFGLTEVSSNISIAGQNAAISTGDAVYWMGTGQFYMYNGTVSQIPCAVKEYVFSDINSLQLAKVSAASNAAFAEIWWVLSFGWTAKLNDKYVVFNYESNIWYYGTMSRTAWHDNAFVRVTNSCCTRRIFILPRVRA
jgi:hypothetical protein